ncbi:MAG: Rpn family recombination-promoting nuclease/putative transposase, partial [Bdellovibrionales bacterium]|nr:Rpn family recombination-promoting nuclease/putative transposase [Bdellovibrionales bacterium]MBC6416018.1 Rpn family recombination-promoting nuclease/putative transposase [Bdellovibrionales bacterium]
MKKNIPNTTNSSFSHDKFFKDFYSDPKLSQELLQLIFSKEECKAYDLEKLKIEK